MGTFFSLIDDDFFGIDTDDDITKWEKYQIENGKKIKEYDISDLSNVKYVGGLDISFDKTNNKKGCAYLTVYDIIKKKNIYEDYKICDLEIPYVSGFLGFREVKIYKELLDKLKNETPNFYPEVLMVDGFGILHPRGFGSASHIGFICDIPTIGIGKTLLTIDGLNEKQMKQQFEQQCINVGDNIKLIGTSGKIYGVALKNVKNITNPIYVTIGHNISLITAIELVIKTSMYRIPEPIRNSDIESKKYL